MFLMELFADGKPAARLLDHPEFLYGTAGLAGALFVGAVAVFFVDRWRKRAAQTGSPDIEELTDFRSMYERGEITEAEYVKLRQKVAARVKSPLTSAPISEPTPLPDRPPTGNPAVPGPFPPGYFDDPPGLNGTTGRPTPPA